MFSKVNFRYLRFTLILMAGLGTSLTAVANEDKAPAEKKKEAPKKAPKKKKTVKELVQGTWVFNTAQGADVDADTLKMMEDEKISLKFEDNKVTVYSKGVEEESGTFEIEDGKYLKVKEAGGEDEEKMEFTVDEHQLCLIDKGMTLVFDRKAPAKAKKKDAGENKDSKDKKDKSKEKKFQVKDTLGNVYDYKSFKKLYQQTASIVSGTYEKSAPFSKNQMGVTEHTCVQLTPGFTVYRDASLYFGRRFHGFKDEGNLKQRNVLWTFLVDDDNPTRHSLDRLQAGKNYTFFFTGDSENSTLCFEESQEMKQLLEQWKSSGMLNDDELKILVKKSPRIAVVSFEGWGSSGSNPPSYYWAITFLKALKGKELAKITALSASDVEAKDVPYYLKASRNKMIVFLSGKGLSHEDVRGSLPWSEDLETKILQILQK